MSIARAVVVSSFTVILPIVAHAQNQAYLKELPSEQRVLSDIKGSSPEDTAQRQVGAFIQLIRIIPYLHGVDARIHGPLSAAAKQWQADYRAALTRVWMSRSELKHRQVPTDINLSWLSGGYDTTKEFRDDILARFFSPEIRTQYYKAKGEWDAEIQKRSEANTRTYFPTEQVKEDDPKSLDRRVARCIAAGRSQVRCMGDMFGHGVADLMKMFDPSTKTEIDPGLKLAGAYPGPTDFTIMNFGPTAAVMSCGGAVQGRDYNIERVGSKVFVNIVSGNMKLLALELLPDGRLDGKGQKIEVTATMTMGVGGSSPTWSPSMPQTETRTYSPHTAPSNIPQNATQGHAGTMTATTNTPGSGGAPSSTGSSGGSVVTKTCTVGMLGPATEVNYGFLGEIADEVGAEAKSRGLIAHPGIRMGGKYTLAGGLIIEFYPEAAVLECDDVLAGQPYTVEKNANQFFVTIRNGATPVKIELKPDGTLSGSGDVEVSGQKIVGFVPDPESGGKKPVFEKGTATCSIDKTALVTTAVSSQRAVLTVTSGFAGRQGSPDALAAKGMVLLRKNLESILKESGDFPNPPAAPTLYSATAIWANSCQIQQYQSLCNAGIQRMLPFSTGSVVVDKSGKATLPAVPPGVYYLVSRTIHDNKHLVWSVRITLKPGENAITLDEGNATQVNK